MKRTITSRGGRAPPGQNTRNKPGESFRCGPLALDEILKIGKTNYETPEAVRVCASTDKGTSMAGMLALAAQVGVQMQVAHRAPGSAVIVPAMVHWKVGHFAAIVEQKGDRMLMRDSDVRRRASMGRFAHWAVRNILDELCANFRIRINVVNRDDSLSTTNESLFAAELTPPSSGTEMTVDLRAIDLAAPPRGTLRQRNPCSLLPPVAEACLNRCQRA